MDNTRNEANLAYSNAQDMKRTIQGFSDKPKEWIVATGDTLWKIANDVYGHGEFYHLLIHSNPSLSQGDYLQPGQVIVVKPLVDFSELLVEGRLILPGETVWGMYTRRFGTSRWNTSAIKFPPDNFDPDLVFPLQVLEWPSHRTIDLENGNPQSIEDDAVASRCKKALGLVVP